MMRQDHDKQSRDMVRASRFMSMALRHDPDGAGITLDANGWTEISGLLDAFQAHKHKVDRAMLHRIVAADAKGRFVISPDLRRIRAAQGHSVAVDLELEAARPPGLLYHGTVGANLPGIREHGLLRMRRQYVHLSADRETAAIVGGRRGSPVVLTVQAGVMHAAGAVFYRSQNGVWLTDKVEGRWIDWPSTPPPGEMA